MEKTQEKDTRNRNAKPGQDPNRRDHRDNKNQTQDQQLRKEDLPGGTNESRGSTGSGQRQDSN